MKMHPSNRRLGILLSGRGSNFEAIADNVAAGRLKAEIAVVISNVADAPGYESARRRRLSAVCIPSQKRPRDEFDAEVVDTLRKHEVSLVVLAGFMRVIGSSFI